MQHANSLIDWSKRWDQRLDKAPTFKVCCASLQGSFHQEGTLDVAWRGLLTEAESSAAVMKDLELVLVKEVRETLLTWKKANYPTFLGRNKVAKKANADFEKARKYVAHSCLTPGRTRRRTARRPRRRPSTSSMRARCMIWSTASARQSSIRRRQRQKTCTSCR